MAITLKQGRHNLKFEFDLEIGVKIKVNVQSWNKIHWILDPSVVTPPNIIETTNELQKIYSFCKYLSRFFMDVWYRSHKTCNSCWQSVMLTFWKLIFLELYNYEKTFSIVTFVMIVLQNQLTTAQQCSRSCGLHFFFGFFNTTKKKKNDCKRRHQRWHTYWSHKSASAGLSVHANATFHALLKKQKAVSRSRQATFMHSLAKQEVLKQVYSTAFKSFFLKTTEIMDTVLSTKWTVRSQNNSTQKTFFGFFLQYSKLIM